MAVKKGKVSSSTKPTPQPKPKKGRRMWLSRDPVRGDVINPSYEVHYRKPELCKPDFSTAGGYFHGGSAHEFCAAEFERITRFKLKPGECKRVRINVEEL